MGWARGERGQHFAKGALRVLGDRTLADIDVFLGSRGSVEVKERRWMRLGMTYGGIEDTLRAQNSTGKC